MASREYRSRRDTRPPTAFTVYWDVPKVEKIEDPEQESGFVEREVEGEWEELSEVFHFRHKIPADLVLRVQAGNDITNQVANGQQALAIQELLDVAIVEAERFRQLMRDPAVPIDSEMLAGLVQDIITEASERDPQKPGT